MGSIIAEKLNRMNGAVRFLLPMKGVSTLDQDGRTFAAISAERSAS